MRARLNHRDAVPAHARFGHSQYDCPHRSGLGFQCMYTLVERLR